MTTSSYRRLWRFRFLDRGVMWLFGTMLVVGLVLSFWGYAILSDDESTWWPLDDMLTTIYGLVVVATFNGDAVAVPWPLAVGRLLVPASIAGLGYGAYVRATLVRQNIHAAERAKGHTLAFGPATRLTEFLPPDGSPGYLVHLDTADEPVAHTAIYVEVDAYPFGYRSEFAGSMRRRRMDGDLPLWAIAGSAATAERIVVATGSDADALGAIGGLLAELGNAIPPTTIVVEDRTVAINKSIDLATAHPALPIDVVCRDNVAARAIAEVMTGQVSAHGAGRPIEDLVVLLSVGTSLSDLVLVHLVQLLVRYELARGTDESLDVHLVRISDDPVADRSIDFARRFGSFFDFELHETMDECVETLAGAGIEPTTVFVDGVDRDDTARDAEELASRFAGAAVIVDLEDYRSTSAQVVTTQTVVADAGIEFQGPVLRARGQITSRLAPAAATAPSKVEVKELLAHLRAVGCTVRPTALPIDGADEIPVTHLPETGVWSDPALVVIALEALRDSGIVVDLPD